MMNIALMVRMKLEDLALSKCLKIAITAMLFCWNMPVLHWFKLKSPVGNVIATGQRPQNTLLAYGGFFFF